MTRDGNCKIWISNSGGPDHMKMIDASIPTNGVDEVVIRNEAVGVAFADVLIREGLYPGVKLPATPGYEVVGVVVSKGENVETVEVGMRVAALTVKGGYAKYINVLAATVVRVPEALSSAIAASLVLNGLTAYQMLTRCVSLDSTEKILVWGAAGGVGSMLLDLARHFGIKAYGVASASRLEFVASFGAIPINRSRVNVADEIRRLEPDGVDVVFDGVGGHNIIQSQRCLNEGGTVVMFGIQGSLVAGRRNLFHLIRSFVTSPHFTTLGILRSNHGIKGYLIEPWFQMFPDRYRVDLSLLFDLAVNGSIAPHIDIILPMSQAVEAHRRINAGNQLGKIILDPRS